MLSWFLIVVYVGGGSYYTEYKTEAECRVMEAALKFHPKIVASCMQLTK
jgi:hypothetical protein